MVELVLKAILVLLFILRIKDAYEKEILVKKIFLYAVLGGTILASGCAISAFSFAWFSNNNNVTRGFDGSTTGAYFARGNGSEGNPYVINKPIHLYNLAWLQYVGFFKDKEPYFIIERDLDMSGWTLPPIGTTMNPFLGHLDGYDTTHSIGQTATAKISNLTISNSFEKYNDIGIASCRERV